MKCVCGASRFYPSASWKFAFNGQITHLFDSENGEWTVVQPAGRQFQGTLDSDREVTNLEIVRAGWNIQQCHKADLKTRRIRASGSTPSTWIFLLFLYCAILLGIHVGVL
ncbi:unnamed protein product [Nyctereutes procyonoides]|uniref:(raccoon dog) hypothetical protein n=1 Tax=Nyctereutes procyonoides TaxID=34880 RepID=A0A811ZFK8_NYCPR|nr:unnamed protein product [Nyctereutes procyonoides]